MIKRFALALGFGLLILVALLSSRQGIATLILLKDFVTLNATVDSDALASIHSARQLVNDYRAWRTELGTLPSILRTLTWVPASGAEIAAVPELLSFTDSLADAAQPTLDVATLLAHSMAGDASPGDALLGATQVHAQEIASARDALERALTRRARVQDQDFSPGAARILRRLDDLVVEWSAGLRLMKRASTLLGAERPQSYLILAQNSDELRATGGFISAVGVLKVDQGAIRIESFGDSFAVDDLDLVHPLPPAPLQKYMWASQWLIRDANWYADFPKTAAIVQTMYAHDRHLETDGVIAIDTRFIPRLVGAVPGILFDGVPLSPDNVLSLLQASWRPVPPGNMKPSWFTGERKNFLAVLAKSILERMNEGQADPAALLQALWQGLREKSVQVYLNDKDAQQAILNANWGGAVNPGHGDYLFVVDSNVGFNKVNARVARRIAYTVRLNQDGSGDASLDLTYVNPSHATGDGCDVLRQHRDNTYGSLQESCYWNYMRVLTPQGTRLVSVLGASDALASAETPNSTAWGAYMIVGRDTTHTVQWKYYLPRGMWRDHTYSLALQRQAGMPPAPATVKVILPEGYRVRATNYPFTQAGGNEIVFNLVLNRDLTIHVGLEQFSNQVRLNPDHRTIQ